MVKGSVVFLLVALAGCAGGGGHPAGGGSDTAKSADTAQAASASAPVRLTYEQLQGKEIFDHYCAVCHGAGGAGDGFNSYNLDPKPHSLADSAYVAASSDRNLEQVIARGGRGVNMSPEMPAYRGTLSALEISCVISYIRFLSSGRTGG